MNHKLIWVAALLSVFGIVSLAMAQSAARQTIQGHAATVAENTRPSADPAPVEELELAAQELRDATHEMLSARPDANRAALIEAAHNALAKVEAAITNLPPDLLTAEADETA